MLQPPSMGPIKRVSRIRRGFGLGEAIGLDSLSTMDSSLLYLTPAIVRIVQLAATI